MFAFQISSFNSISSTVKLITCVVCCWWLLPCPGNAQNVSIDSIIIEGNKRTKDYILLRELTFKQGDSLNLSEISETTKFNENRLLNTTFFTLVSINLKDLDLEKKNCRVVISVKEALYVIGVPLLEIFDSDFNKWWNTYNHSLKFLSYGLKFKHRNLTGNTDNLDIYAQLGFTKKIALDYFFPVINRSQTLGLGISAYHSRNREIASTTENNIYVFSRNQDKDQLIRSKAGVLVRFRPGLFDKHTLSLSYHNVRISDTVNQFINPDYFNGLTKLQFGEISYMYDSDHRNIIPYSTDGYLLRLWGTTNLFAPANIINTTIAGFLFAKYLPVVNRVTSEHIISGRYNIDRGKVPYYFNRALGSKELYLRAYENYVLDGQDYLYFKNSLRYNFLNFTTNWGRFMLLKNYQTMPANFYLTGNVDIGRVKDAFYGDLNSYSNRWLTGYGIGLDVVLYHTNLLRFECSRTHNGDIGLFLHFELGL